MRRRLAGLSPVRKGVLRFLDGIGYGSLRIHEGDRVDLLGEGNPGPTVDVTVHSSRFWTRTLRGSTGMAESYICGEWDCEDLVGLTTLAGQNLDRLDQLRRPFHPITGWVQRLGLTMPRTTRSRGKSQIAAHYDLGNELFSLFLDPSMNYSSAVYIKPEDNLEAAQINKMNRIADRLELGPDDHLLEIGTGWGGLAVHLVERTGCRITTTTISREQAALARKRVEDAGLNDRIEVIETDYRDLSGTFDRLVSVEMIEAVGWRDFPTYFNKCSSLLKPGGAMLLQAIVIDDDAYEMEKASRSFISHFIFPGGCLPSVAEINRCLDEGTDMRSIRVDEIGADYARTLSDWRDRFMAVTDRLEALGYDRRFRRMWVLYMCVAEGGFRSGRNDDVQMLLAKPDFSPAASGSVQAGDLSLTQPSGNAPAGTSPS
ncbi:MAG: cyclopropane-fatty-acyl-phospholipid synthase family protein [Solirubrobacterales bacterium]